MRSSVVLLALALCASGQAQTLIAHWTLEEIAEGVVRDVTGNGHDAQVGPEGAELPEVLPGMVGNALAFVGEKQHFLNVGASGEFNFTGPFTVMAWVKPTRRNAAFEVLCFKGDKSGEPPWPGWRLRYFWTRAMLQLGTPDGQEPSASSPEWSVPAGFWSHIAATWDGARLRAFVNAVEEGSTDFSGPIAPQPAGRSLVIGNYIGRKDAYAFDGLLDDVKVIGGALTEEQVLLEASAEPGG